MALSKNVCVCVCVCVSPKPGLALVSQFEAPLGQENPHGQTQTNGWQYLGESRFIAS